MGQVSFFAARGTSSCVHCLLSEGVEGLFWREVAPALRHFFRKPRLLAIHSVARLRVPSFWHSPQYIYD